MTSVISSSPRAEGSSEPHTALVELNGVIGPGTDASAEKIVAALNAAFTTLLMSTGLTFGTISALYGLNAGIIDRTQFSLLVATVVLSAVVPTAIAQRFYQPRLEELRDITAPVPPAQLAGE